MISDDGPTPGPWNWLTVSANASGGFHLYLIDPTKRKIAALWGGAKEKVANAALISAAPDLHRALEMLLDEAPGRKDTYACHLAQAALRKARGPDETS